MVAMFGSMTGLHISNVNQANLSALGARKNCSPTPKGTGICAALIATYIIEILCMLLSVTYLRYCIMPFSIFFFFWNDGRTPERNKRNERKIHRKKV